MENVSFIEQDFEPKTQTLKDLQDKLKKEGLSFHPIMAMNAISKEVETRLSELLKDHFKGMKIEMLGECNAEIREYTQAEDARWAEFQMKQKQLADEILLSDVKENLESEVKKIPENVKPIKSKKK